MRQRGYAIAFALVLVAIVAGAYFASRFAVERVRQDFRLRQEWTPPVISTSAATEATLETAAPTARPTRTQIVIPTPAAPSPEPFTPVAMPSSAPREAVALATVSPETPTQAAVTSTPVLTQVPIQPFQAKGTVRSSQGDCGGILVLGLVSDRNGMPLPGVRLRLVDEYQNEAFAVTKAGEADRGRYDFPVSGPARRLFITIVDERGSPLSRLVSFDFYGDAPDAQATCYRIDWQGH